MAVKDHSVLLVGCGSIGVRHARCLREIGVEKMVFFDPDITRSEALAKEYGGIAVKSYEEGLLTNVDAVYILSPTALHIEQATLAVKAGKHVFLEKPLSDKLEGIDALEELAKEQGVTVEVGFCFRFHEGVRRLAQIIRSGKIGKTVCIKAMMGEHFPDVRPDYLSTYYVKYSGAFELVHDLDLAIFLAGEEPVAYHGFFGSYSGLGFESPDQVEMLVQFESCLANVHLDFYQSPRTRTMTVIGTEGQAVLEFASWDHYTLSTYTRESGAWERTEGNTRRDDMFCDESINFFCTIDGTAENECPLSEAVRSLKICKSINP